jgi:hypothetical protein
MTIVNSPSRIGDREDRIHGAADMLPRAVDVLHKKRPGNSLSAIRQSL